MDNLPEIINVLKIFQKADYIHTKDQETSNHIYYAYDRAISILEEIEKRKKENYIKSKEV